MASKMAQRWIAIVDLLHRFPDGLTTPEIHEHLQKQCLAGSNVRNTQRDLQRMRDSPIIALLEHGGRPSRWAVNLTHRSVVSRQFDIDPDVLPLLSIACELLDGALPPQVFASLGAYRDKIAAEFPGAHDWRKSLIVYQPEHWYSQASEQSRNAIFESLSVNRQLRFTYPLPDSGESEHVVSPFRLLVKDDQVFLLAWEQGALRQFAVCFVQEAKTLDAKIPEAHLTCWATAQPDSPRPPPGWEGEEESTRSDQLVLLTGARLANFWRDQPLSEHQRITDTGQLINDPVSPGVALVPAPFMRYGRDVDQALADASDRRSRETLHRVEADGVVFDQRLLHLLRAHFDEITVLQPDWLCEHIDAHVGLIEQRLDEAEAHHA